MNDEAGKLRAAVDEGYDLTQGGEGLGFRIWGFGG